MAATSGVWGIDIGQCALKALRCEYDNENDVLVATAFDYIEHPKILSQPDANPHELIQEALSQFLERNDVRGDDIAISVPGQNGLTRFFQPPPVDVKRLPEIVRFEARQQIPFPLEEVVWDYQKMLGATEVDGFLMDAEVGLFAMKRDQVYEAMKPYMDADLEVDHIQLAPLCAYNFVAHNLLTETMEMDIYDPDNPPESYIIMNVGTDTTDLVITNGFRVWQRNIPLGGNHFTKQLTKELKLTFAKAEHLKRNIREAEDAKAVIQAMRPVFNDMLTEVQRSVGFFQNLDRRAEISGMIMLGNAMKLPGLQQYLAKNLGYSIVDVDHESWASRLAGEEVLSAAQFKENIYAFGVCYGLCLQGLKKAKLSTNLLPQELLTARLIRAKKPWALATAAALMLAFSINFFFGYREWQKVHPATEVDGVPWSAAMTEVENVQSTSSRFDSEDAQEVSRLEELTALGRELSGNSDRRILWLEMIRAVNKALPQTPGLAPNQIPDPMELPISQRQELHIEYIETQYFDDLSTWFTETVKTKYLDELQRLEEQEGNSADPTATPDDASAAADGPAAPAEDEYADDPYADDEYADDEYADDAAADGEGGLGPSGPGWVIEMKGYHYFNDDIQTWGGTHVRDTFLKNLREQTVTLPKGPGEGDETFTMEELGIGFGILAQETPIVDAQVPNPYYEPPPRAEAPEMGPDGMTPLAPAAAAETPAATPEEEEPSEPLAPPFYSVRKYSFIVQFCWQEKLLSERLQAREEKARLEAEAAAAAADGVDPVDSDTGLDETDETQPADPNAAAASTGE